MSQTSINAGGNRVGDPGDSADAGPKDVLSGFNADATQMPFGVGVAVNANSGDFYSLPTGYSNAYPVSGVFLRRANYQPRLTLANGQVIGNLGPSGVHQYAPLNVMVKGRILVPVEAAVTRDQRAWCRGVATGTAVTSAQKGTWRGAAAGSAPAAGTMSGYFLDCSRQAVFRSGSFTAADGTTLVAVLECDFTTGVV